MDKSEKTIVVSCAGIIITAFISGMIAADWYEWLFFLLWAVFYTVFMVVYFRFIR